MAETGAKTTRARKPSAKAPAVPAVTGSDGATGIEEVSVASSRKTEAKSRFNAALEEARAGANLLGAEARERAGTYKNQARAKGEDWTVEAKTKAAGLAKEGKSRASEALTSLGKVVADNAVTIDEKVGAKYGDYARSASRSLQNTATKLDEKSIEELGEDARELVRKSPAAAVGLAALAGFFLARIFRR